MSIENEAKNLGAIKKAIVQHNGNCGFPILAILMNPFEVERLGWDSFEGIPIQADDKLGTGRFRLLCEGNHGEPEVDEVEDAIGTVIEVEGDKVTVEVGSFHVKRY